MLVTVRFAKLPLFDDVLAELEQAADLTPSLALVTLLEAAVDRAADHLEHAAEMVADVAATIFSDSAALRPSGFSHITILPA